MYEVKIAECSKALTGKQKVQIIDTTDCVKLDKATQVEPVEINVDYWAVLSIHNDKASDPDYFNYVIVDKDGTRYSTGSQSFWNNFTNIFDAMSGETEEWILKVYRMPSRNREGKDFITCSVI